MKRYGGEILSTFPSLIVEIVISLSGSLYLLILICVNLLGYAVGVGGIMSIISKCFSLRGLVVIIVYYYFLSVGVSLMRKLRQMGFSKP